MRIPKVGEYFYCRRLSRWAVYEHVTVDEHGCGTSSLVCKFDTMEEARNLVYEHNGWKKKWEQ